MNTNKKLTFDPADDDFGTLVICAVRYSIGRCTYMPGLICDYLRPRLFLLDARTISCMERDIRNASFYGDDIDHEMWLAFLKELRAEMAGRGIDPWQ